MIKFLDKFLSLLALMLLFPLILFGVIISYWDTGSPIFIQKRVGRYKKPFKLYKLRTMKIGTESVASHLVNPSSISSLGVFLRKTKIDELLQLVNVLKGDMSLVGPRPNLYSQIELIEIRDLLGCYSYLPGVTGIAQLNNIDMSNPSVLAKIDIEMMSTLSVGGYVEILMKTALGKGYGDAAKNK